MRAIASITAQPGTRPSEPRTAEDSLQQGRDGEWTLAAVDRPPSGEPGSGGTRAFANGSEAFCRAEAGAGPVVMRIAEPVVMADLSAYLNTGVSVAALKGALAEARAAVDQDKAPAVPAPTGKDVGKPGSGEKEEEAAIGAALAAGAGEPKSTAEAEAGPTAVWPPLQEKQTATFNAMPGDEDVETDMAVPELAETDARASHAETAAPVASGGALVRAEHRASRPEAPDEWRSREREPSPLGWASIAQLMVLVLLPVVVAALGAFAVAAQGERVHAARSEIVFDLRNVAWGAAERFLETQAVVARSRTLLAPIADAFAIPITELDRAFVVEAVRDSDVIRLEYAHPDPVLARNVTKAITDRYLVTLREFERLDGTRHRLLTPAFVLDEPVAPKPLRAAAMGAAIGLMIGLIVLILRIQAWLPQRS